MRKSKKEKLKLILSWKYDSYDKGEKIFCSPFTEEEKKLIKKYKV